MFARRLFIHDIKNCLAYTRHVVRAWMTDRIPALTVVVMGNSDNEYRFDTMLGIDVASSNLTMQMKLLSEVSID